eukprot:747513-Hanusia_phi.AAC.2
MRRGGGRRGEERRADADAGADADADADADGQDHGDCLNVLPQADRPGQPAGRGQAVVQVSRGDAAQGNEQGCCLLRACDPAGRAVYSRGRDQGRSFQVQPAGAARPQDPLLLRNPSGGGTQCAKAQSWDTVCDRRQAGQDGVARDSSHAKLGKARVQTPAAPLPDTELSLQFCHTSVRAVSDELLQLLLWP